MNPSPNIENLIAKENITMKASTKIAIVASVAAALGAFVAGVAYEVKAIKKLTTDADDALPEEILENENIVVEVIDAK